MGVEGGERMGPEREGDESRVKYLCLGCGRFHFLANLVSFIVIVFMLRNHRWFFLPATERPIETDTHYLRKFFGARQS